MNVNATNHFDIVICGGSFVGLALARALSAMAPGIYKIAVVEQRPLVAPAGAPADGRTVAVVSSVKAMLEAIGVWPALAGKAQPILRIELSDSSLEAPVRPSLIGLDFERGAGRRADRLYRRECRSIARAAGLAAGRSGCHLLRAG